MIDQHITKTPHPTSNTKHPTPFKMYFIAILANDEISKEAIKHKKFMLERFGCKVALRSPPHVTLIPPFNMKEDLKADLVSAMDAFALTHSRFHFEVKDFSSFPPRVIFINVVLNDALSELHASFEDHLIAFNKFPIKKETRPYHPHITIATRDLDKKDFHKAWPHFSHLSFYAKQDVTAIVLLESSQSGWRPIHSSALKP
jgi:2'-5' RNA ligase